MNSFADRFFDSSVVQQLMKKNQKKQQIDLLQIIICQQESNALYNRSKNQIEIIEFIQKEYLGGEKKIGCYQMKWIQIQFKFYLNQLNGIENDFLIGMVFFQNLFGNLQ
ncbi:unnamed protein product [Paramecium sonneborni]|uniref:Uncharacterized protein n=1 Tax=Paramecium sonneborni TaxID=65129 RepID=A0A8S1RST1_9CILI|nr:unnamed protein product [Paramecium sonneborni]